MNVSGAFGSDSDLFEALDVPEVGQQQLLGVGGTVAHGLAAGSMNFAKDSKFKVL